MVFVFVFLFFENSSSLSSFTQSVSVLLLFFWAKQLDAHKVCVAAITLS